MKANAWHHRADAVSSVVALVGVGNNLSPTTMSVLVKISTYCCHLSSQNVCITNLFNLEIFY